MSEFEKLRKNLEYIMTNIQGSMEELNRLEKQSIYSMYNCLCGKTFNSLSSFSEHNCTLYQPTKQEMSTSVKTALDELAIKVDPSIPKDEVHFRHPDGRVDKIVNVGTDKPNIPDGAYWNKEDGMFRSHLTNHHMGNAFFDRWYNLRFQFPTVRKEPEMRYLSGDQRIVSRKLLEEIAAVMHETYDIGKICDTKQFAQVLVQLNKALEIEKPVLQSSLKPFEPKDFP